MKLSVIIPCLNEEHYIARLLDDLVAQTAIELEVVVVDSGSTDGTVRVAESYQDRLPLSVVSTGRGVAKARNAGAAAAKGEWLLFLDADVQLPKTDYAKTMVTEAESRGYITASSKFELPSGSFMDNIGSKITFSYMKLLSHTQHPVACGFCILTRRADFDRVKGFDEALRVGEDYDYVSRSAGGRPNHFGFITSTYFYVDIRRFEEGGKVVVFLKSIGYEIYRFTHGFRIVHDPFHYKFGEHGRPKPVEKDRTP